MKLISWNVNGIRAVLGKGFMDFVKEEKPDILGLQEIKAMKEQVDIDMKSLGYTDYWYSAEKKGYSGTALFTKVEPLSVTYGLGIDEHDKEGRIITAEFKDFFLVIVYTPNVKPDLSRLAYRQVWDKEFLKHMKKLEKKKPVFVCGDLNVAHKEIDLKNPKSNKGHAGFTDEERAGIQNYLDNGFIDTFREFNKEPNQYSWWSYRFNARAKNIGWRIDYFLASEKLKSKLKKAFILPAVMGSDHCPVGVETK